MDDCHYCGHGTRTLSRGRIDGVEVMYHIECWNVRTPAERLLMLPLPPRPLISLGPLPILSHFEAERSIHTAPGLCYYCKLTYCAVTRTSCNMQDIIGGTNRIYHAGCLRLLQNRILCTKCHEVTTASIIDEPHVCDACYIKLAPKVEEELPLPIAA